VIKNNKLLLKLEPELKHNKPRLDLWNYDKRKEEIVQWKQRKIYHNERLFLNYSILNRNIGVDKVKQGQVVNTRKKDNQKG
jgi:hypothetical protein